LKFESRGYIAPLLHVLVVASHFILAFSHAACVFGAANAGAVKATARPRATIVEMRVFIGLPSVYGHFAALAPYYGFPNHRPRFNPRWDRGFLASASVTDFFIRRYIPQDRSPGGFFFSATGSARKSPFAVSCVHVEPSKRTTARTADHRPRASRRGSRVRDYRHRVGYRLPRYLSQA
jgi:hypothetical protein